MINILFIGSPSKATIENQKLLNAKSLPIKGRFVATPTNAFAYLAQCNSLHFPDVIILDDDMGNLALTNFLKEYRQSFYLHQMDSLLYISSEDVETLKLVDRYPLVAGYLVKPLTKAIFLKEIYPMISFTMV